MERLLWICAAGALGTGVRYLIGLGAAKWLGDGFPFGTFAVNVLGCFLIALVMRLAATTAMISEGQRLALTTGFLGGLTTYSAFNYETTTLLQDRMGAGIANLVATLVACLLAGLAGAALAGRITG